MSAPKPPMTMPNGQMMPYMSARRRTQMVDALWEAAGGFPRALAWIEKSDENYGEFFKGMWAKGTARPLTVEHNVGGGVEDLLEKLDRAANAKTIDGEFTEVENAPSKQRQR